MAVEIFTQPVDKNFMREFTRMEYKCLLDFAKSAEFYYADSRNQLRDLWTAYCLHHDAYIDNGCGSPQDVVKGGDGYGK